MVTNHQVLFNQVTRTGLPEPGTTTRPSSTELDIDNVPLNGGVLTRNIAVSLNYKTEDVLAKLKAFAGDTGIHYYYDNVGGTQLEAYISVAARYGIIVACGYISGYNAEKEDIYYPKNLFNVVSKELKYQGFLVSSYISKWLPTFMEEMPKMLAEGKIKNREDVMFGVWGAEDAFKRLFTGDNNGKVAVLIDVEHADKWNLGEQKKKAAKVWN